MITFPSMLSAPASQAGIPVPPNPEEYEADDFPLFHVFCILQLGRRMKMDGEQWRNAEVIAKVDPTKVKTMTLQDFLDLGLEWPE